MVVEPLVWNSLSIFIQKKLILFIYLLIKLQGR